MQRSELPRGECVISEWLSFLNRSRNAAAEPTASDTESAPEAETKPPARRTRTRRSTAAAEETAETTEATVEATEAPAATEDAATESTTETSPRRRGGRRRTTTTEGAASTPEAPDASTEATEIAGTEPGPSERPARRRRRPAAKAEAAAEPEILVAAEDGQATASPDAAGAETTVEAIAETEVTAPAEQVPPAGDAPVEAVETAAEDDTEAATADASADVAEADEEDTEPDSNAAAESDGAEDRPRRRSRGSRGGSRRRRDTSLQNGIDAALEHSEAAEMPPGAPRHNQPRRAAPPQRDTSRREAPQQPSRQQPPARTGSVESLVARQNVLFEEFAAQQAQTLREVQRAVRGVGGAQGASGNTLARPKVGIFVDVPNLIYASEQMGVRVHFGKLLDYLTEGRQLVRATAYAPITDDPQTRFEAQRFVAPVVNNGYKIVTKPWKRFADGSMKANFDIELAVDILTMSDRLDIVVLLSGDGDFRRVCELIESKGVRVEVVAFSQSCAKELREVADLYTDLGTILNIVGG